MNTLPRGITGFWKIGQSGIPKTDKSLIKKLVDIFKSDSDFWKVRLVEQQADNNFYLILISDKNGNHQIGINTTYPIYCGIKSLADWETVEFCNLPEYITKIIPIEFTELRTEFLNEPLKSKHITALNKVELEQIKYWKTEKIGNVIFNKYD
ncbi:hypothetical protein [Aquimarina rubra]|uniref:Uncharacterized protein n=1 Tax=Aquimarina rubra TaxID=1920033 RepID=A0ABW5LKZ7_9FLAO